MYAGTGPRITIHMIRRTVKQMMAWQTAQKPQKITAPVMLRINAPCVDVKPYKDVLLVIPVFVPSTETPQSMTVTFIPPHRAHHQAQNTSHTHTRTSSRKNVLYATTLQCMNASTAAKPSAGSTKTPVSIYAPMNQRKAMTQALVPLSPVSKIFSSNIQIIR